MNTDPREWPVLDEEERSEKLMATVVGPAFIKRRFGTVDDWFRYIPILLPDGRRRLLPLPDWDLPDASILGSNARNYLGTRLLLEIADTGFVQVRKELGTDYVHLDVVVDCLKKLYDGRTEVEGHGR